MPLDSSTLPTILADTADGLSGGGDLLELAQLVAQAQPGGESIGQVSAVEGAVTITRTDGAKVTAAAGTPIFQGDLVETKAAGAIGLTFADESTFSLADNGSMVIDQMIYDPGTQKGSSAITVAQGVFTFVSGQIAKTDVDAMLVKTPIAVIGIRGTAGGGRSGPEGTPNTFSLFVDPRGGPVGEMTIKTQGGSVVLNQPLQTTQMSSAFVPPIKPIVLPPGVATQFYSKATTLAPTKPVFTTTAPGAGPIGGPVGPAGGPAGDPGAPAGGPLVGPIGPAGGPAGPVGAPVVGPGPAADQAAAAFANALAAGGSLDAAIGAAVNMAGGVQLQGTLAINPNAFGSLQSGNAIMNAIADKVVLGVTGQFDMMGAGTGGSAGFTAVTGNFFTNAIGDALRNDVAAFAGGMLADLGIGGQAFQFGGGFDPLGAGGGLFGAEFGAGFGPGFGPGFGDPFAFGPGFGDPFAFDPFGFGFAPPPEFDAFFETAFVGIFTDIFTTQGTTAVFDEFLTGSAGGDTIVGTGLNTQITMVQGSSLSGTDIVDGGGGTDELFLGNLSDIDIVYVQTSASGASPITGTITYSGAGATITGSMSLTSIEQISVNDGASGFQRLAFDTSDANLIGYIRAGTSSDNILSLAQTTNLQGTLGTGDPVGAASTLLGGIMFGGGGNDTLTGTEASDIIFGGTGNDTLNGNKAGTDFGDAIFGGDGDDTFVISAPADILISSNPFGSYQAGETAEVSGDTLQLVAGGGTYTLSTSGGLFGLTGFEVLNIVDTTTATTTVQTQSSFLTGLTSILTGLDNDTGNDALKSTDSSLDLGLVSSVGSGIEFLEATNTGSGVFIRDAGGTDVIGRTLTGTSSPDTLNGQGGNDNIIGHAGPDTLTGGSGADNFGWVNSEVAAAGSNSAAYDTLSDFASGTSNDIFVWEEALDNTAVSLAANGTFSATNFFSGAISGETQITSDTARVIFEFTGASLGSSFDIIKGTTTSAAIESAAAAALANVDHTSGDDLLFAMYDNGASLGGTSSVAFLKFTGDATTTGITASELQVVAVADIAQDSLITTNFNVNALPG